MRFILIEGTILRDDCKSEIFS